MSFCNLSISVFTQKSIKIFHSVQAISPFSLFQNLALGKASTDDKCHFAIVSVISEFEPRQKLNQSQMSFDNLMEYILSISMCMQNFITIFHSVQAIAPLSYFQNLELGKASINEKYHFAISWARSCHYQCLRNCLSKYSTQFKRESFSLFQNLALGKAPTVILQFLELDLVNINVSAKFYQNIPNGFRVKFHCFQNLNLGAKPHQSKMSFDYLMGYIMSKSMCMQNSLQYSTQFKRWGHFHFFRIWSSAKPRPMKNVISQSLGLDLVNINVYAKVYQNIPLSSREWAIFTFSEFGARQSLDQ